MKILRANFTFIVQVSVVGAALIAATLIVGGQAPQAPVDLGGSERYLTYISTDKPIYRTGEKLYVRGVVLRSDGHFPMTSPQNATGTASFEIKGPKGDTVASGVAGVVDSIVGFSWDVPANQAGGEYTVRITHPSGDAPAERKFDIRAYRAPRLKSQIVFVRDGYGPGDTVSASLHVERAEGGIPAGAKVSVVARVDGEQVWQGETSVDASGNASASFKLPAAIARGEGVIGMTIQDGGAVETAARTIPILLQTLDLAIYPEGGDLIAGLTNRVYVEGRTPAQKPADMVGVIINSAGREVATFRTEHEGRGRFSFVPSAGEVYSLRVTEPAGIRKVFPLPAVRESGVVISARSDVSERQKDVAIRVAATREGTYGVALSQRGKEMAFKSLTLRANQAAEVAFSVPRSLDGVIVATVYDGQMTPKAERLLFRQPDSTLNVKVVADRSDYVPSDKVTLRVTTTDETGKPVSAVIGLTVTDSSVLEMIEKREQAPQLPVMVLFENDVRNLSDAHVYLDATNPKAPLATDLLLGTQGWRRFAFVDPANFLVTYNDAARRVLAIRTPTSLSGEIRDARDAVIPGVNVRALNTASGQIFTAVTNERGIYAFPGISPGTYQLTASSPGYQTRTVAGLQAPAFSKAQQDLRLEVALANGRGGGAGGGVGPGIGAGVGAGVGAGAGDVFGGVLLQNQAAQNQDAKRLEELAKNGLRVEEAPRPPQPPLPVATPPPASPPAAGAAPAAGAPARGAGAGGGGGRGGGGGFAQGQRVLTVAQTVREYAHTLRPSWTEGSRVDFAETVYWHAGVRTDAATGSATVAFNLSDSVTAFRVLADGFTHDGVLGSSINHVESVQPFSIEPKIPLQITSGDVIQLPISVVNGTSRELRDAQLTASGAAGLKFTMLGDNASTLGPKERARRLVQINVGPDFSGPANLTVDARAGAYRDSVGRKLDVQPMGFPHETSTGGMLESNSSKSFEFTLPREIVKGSMSSTVTVYPSPLASMTDALQSLLRQPNGCFEQTSSTSYPMVMAQQYFLTHTGIDPAIIEKAKDLLEASYKRLTGFESRSKGYEWFGADPGHEALTAYGLLQFTDMSKVRSVEQSMLDRTRDWLLARRDGKGGFNLSAKALDSFGRAPTETTNAYITWALVESGERGLEKEIAFVKTSAGSTQDNYIVALIANILHATGDRTGARPLMEKLSRSQDDGGNVKGGVTSITRSGGDALTIETTALSVLAWMREPDYAAQAERGLRWIVGANKGGRFGSTQSTILALKSIIAYDTANARPKAPGRLALIVDGKTVGNLAFNADSQGALLLPEFASELGPGRHTVALGMEDGSRMPFSINVKYYSELPDSAPQTEVSIQVSLKDRQIQEGGITEAIVSIANKSDDVVPSPVAIVGIPGGLEVRHDQLKELVKSGRIDAYEVIGREVVLYWRRLKAKDKFDLPLSLIAAVPGSYTGPASRAYLYYTDEYKTWSPALKVNITPR